MKPAVLATNEIEKPIVVKPLPENGLLPVAKPTSGIEGNLGNPVNVLKPMAISAQIEAGVTKPSVFDHPADALIEQERAGSIQLVPMADRILDAINRFHDRYNSPPS